jgi:hypothetical protein
MMSQLQPRQPAPNGNGTARKRRMTLESVTTTPKFQPMRILLYGVEKIGKTMFATEAPAPIFIGPEDGFPVDCQTAPRFPLPESWADALDAIDELTERENQYQTLVIDTVDWLEPLIWQQVCSTAQAHSIEDVGGGYGKGYTAALDEWRKMLSALERLRAKRRMHVILLGHSQVRTFKNPEGADFDRYSLKINEKAAGLLKEWSDAVLFANYETIAKAQRNAKAKGLDTGARRIHTERRAAFDAGNRYSLPEVLALSWSEFDSARNAGSAMTPDDYRTAIAAMASEASEELRSKVEATVAAAGDDTAKLAQISNRLSAALAKEQQ